jgi:hypothetical protein
MAYLETVNQGNPNSLSEAWPVEITDGTNVLGTSAHPLEVAGTVTATNPSVSATGATVPADATMVGAENPSGDLEPLNVDASGYLEVNVKAGSAGNSAASATGAAVPADADYIGYENGSGDLTGVSASTPLPVTDAAAETSLATLAGAVSASKVQVAGTVAAEIEGHSGASLDAAPGSAIPTNALLMGGSDGTDLRAIATDTSGQVKVLIENGSAIPISGTITAEIEGHSGASLDAAPGSAIPTNALLMGGSDGTDLRAIATDSSGQQKVLVENEVEVQGQGTAGSPAGGVVSVQGVSSGTPLPTQDQANGAVSNGTAASYSELQGLEVTTSAPSCTNGKQNAAQGDTAANLRINPFGSVGAFASETLGATSPGATGTTTTMFTVPSATKWLLKCIRVTYTSSSTAASRQFQAYVQDNNGNLLFQINGAVTQAASNTYVYVYGPSLPLAAAQTGGTVTFPFPEMCLGPGFKIGIYTIVSESNDSFTAAVNVHVLPD